jgi:hypothetical protein
LWALDPDKVAVLLQQFHLAASPRSVSVGRRPGPDGAFAVLQGVSETHLDVAFRAHAEFNLVPGHARGFPALYAWYTPSRFMGRVVVNRKAGAIEYFHLAVPTDQARNVHGTVWASPDAERPEGYRIYQFLRAERMELVGGSSVALAGVRWAERIETARAQEKLARAFYKFEEIDFVPFGEALAVARARNRPIFAVVALGALDDQSC